MTENLPARPQATAQVEPYLNVLGFELTIEFLMTFGGADLDFPKMPTENHRLVKLVGLEKTIELTRSTNRHRKRIPTAKPWLAQALFSQGLSKAEISRRLHTTDVTIRKWLSRPRVEWRQNPDTQLDLFPEYD